MVLFMRSYIGKDSSEMDKAWKTHVFKYGIMVLEVVDTDHVKLKKVYVKYWLHFCTKTEVLWKTVHRKGNEGGP